MTSRLNILTSSSPGSSMMRSSCGVIRFQRTSFVNVHNRIHNFIGAWRTLFIFFVQFLKPWVKFAKRYIYIFMVTFIHVF